MKTEIILAASALSFAACAALAGTSCRDGVATALPAPGGGVAIDGDLSDWNRSAPVLVWNADEFAETENATLYFMHDEANFYVAYEMTLMDGRMPTNKNRPSDRFWCGDLVQVRLCTDPAIGWPLPDRKSPVLEKNPRVTCINLWRDTKAGVDYIHITPGAMLDCPAVTNPEGSAVKTASEPGRLVVEARIPWAALGIPGGKRPFAVGERMPAVADVKWSPGMDGHSAAAVFANDPGTFAFMNIRTWGRIEFAGRRTEDARPAPLADRYAAIAKAVRGAAGPDDSDWTPIVFNLPKRAKVSVNVFDERGGVIRELMGGEWRNAGRVEVRWDGRDACGFPCEAGRDYRWGVFAHDGLDVVYEGTVGVSGEPPYETPDGTGGWGADHGPVVACAADETGRYFVWHMSEQGAALVKTDFDGKVVWRANPFVRGGWGEYTAACAADGALWLVHQKQTGKSKPALVKIDAATGRHVPFPDGKPFVVIEAIGPERPEVAVAGDGFRAVAARPHLVFNCAGIAARGDALFVSDLNGNRIVTLDAKTGAQKGAIPCAAPRGLAVAPDGSLWAVSGKGVARLDCRKGLARPRPLELGTPLDAPYALAFGADGTLYVSDLGASQQIRAFSAACLSGAAPATPAKVFGRRGGRGFLGKIDYGAFLFPFGLAVDKTGALLVAETSAPKIVSVMDAVTGVARRRYFGYSAYSPSNVPDCDDPRLQYYSISLGGWTGGAAFARQRLGEAPEAAWDFSGGGLGEFGGVLSTMTMPEVMRGDNGLKYLVPDGTADYRTSEKPMTICLVGKGDVLTPVAGVFRDPPAKKGAPCTALRLWMDLNGDGRRQAGEFVAVTNVAGRVWRWAYTTGAMFMERNGTLFLLTGENAVIGIPSRGFDAHGAPRWDVAAAYVAIPEILPGRKTLSHSWRSGMLGLRRDSSGNFYAAVNCNLDYATPELTKAMKLGMGHTSEFTAVLLCKFAPDGTPLWRVGRKATGGLKPGEMLHHWCLAGMVGDGFTAAASEWGVATVYTADGFFVDSLFDAPGKPGRGAPYSFGGEDFSGRIVAFPERGEVWAYNFGHAFRVTGFEASGDGFRVAGEWRTEGTVRLGRVAPLFVPGAAPKPLTGVTLRRAGGKVVFAAHVVDDSPLVNAASGADAVFKGGDAVGFEIGPGRKTGKGFVFTRILAARIGGKDRVVALQTGGTRLNRPQEYTTTAGGTAAFSFVGDAPGATVAFETSGDGYNVRIEVPETLFELDFAKPVFWDAEALFSGVGGRGVGTVRRVYLHNEETAQTSMVDDVPTEARLHPEGYAEALLQDSDAHVTLSGPGFATVVIEEAATGRRVRNLLAAEPLEAGTHRVEWDGYDDAGEPCAAGEYRWRGLVRGKVESRYRGAFYSPGDPPWRTTERSCVWNVSAIGAGGWLSDHVPPLCVAAGGNDVFVGAQMAEAGCAMIRVNAETGRKVWGTSMVALSGASAFARDGDTLFVAGEGGWSKDKLSIVRLNLKTYGLVPNPDAVAQKRRGANIHQRRASAFVVERQSEFSGIRGMALAPDEIVLSLSDKGGRLVCFSRETAEFTREIGLPAVGQLAVAPDGAIWAACEKGLTRVFAATERAGSKPAAHSLPLAIRNPRGLAIDAVGNFYVSDVAPERQCVEVYAPDGKHLRTIGTPGGRHEGKFDPSAMSNPVSLCIDARGLLWVAESEIRPKRVSVWNPASGALVRDYLGTPYYGGGGSIDAKEGFAYYDGMRFRLAPDLSGATLDAILYRPEEHPDVSAVVSERHRKDAPSTVRRWRGRTLLVSDSGYACKPFIGEVVGDRLVPRVVVGNLVATNASGKAKKTVGAVLWQDGERTECEGPRAAMMWSARLGSDMEMVLRIPSPNNEWRTDALAILRPDGDLRYDFAKMQRLELPDELRGAVFACAVTPDGKAIVVNAGRSSGRGEGVLAAVSVADGRLLWSYPNPYPSNGHNSPLPDRGELRHTCGFEGWAGPFFQLNGNKGTRYLFTADGLFVAELFGDTRLAPSQTALRQVKPNDILSAHSLTDECFGGWLGEGRGGAALQIVGKSSLSICEVAGLDGVRRLAGGKIALAKAPPPKAALPPTAQGPAVVMDCGGFGFQRGWQDAAKRAFPEDKVAEVAFGVSRSGGGPGPLRLWAKVRDPSPWTNGGIDPETLFKTGDCIDLRWAADPTANPKRRTPAAGDVRLLFAPDGKGGAVAVKYVFVDAAVAPEARRSFTSPTGTAYVDRVEQVAVKAHVAKTKDGYEFTADIPWSVLGEKGKPAHGETRRADVGVLLGDADGTTVVRRAYLFDQESQVVSDLPSEVRVTPSNWGAVKF